MHGRAAAAAGRGVIGVALLVVAGSSALAGCDAAGSAGAAEAEERAARGASQGDIGFRGVVLPEPITKVDFTLTDTDGRPFTFREQTDGYLTFLFFGYTNCPDICPVHMSNLGAVLRRYPHDVRSRVRVVFVTTDPERDSPAAIRRWLDAFDPSFIGLTGTAEEIDGVQLAFGVAPARREGDPEGDGEYGVGHAAQVIAFTPDNLGRVVYPFGTRQADWLRDIPKLLSHQVW
ncbi:MAG: SCO family protein [Longimicrobiales bacterium]